MRRVLVVLAVAAVAVVAPAAHAGYQVVGNGFVQWDWAFARSANEIQLTDAVVRPDGWMIVGTVPRYDAFLHLLPPWGAEIGTWNRFGPDGLALRQLEITGGKLYGLGFRREFGWYTDPDKHSVARLFELDLQTGEILRELGEWWNQDLTVDPQTGDLVLQTTSDRDPFPRDVVRFDPDTGAKTVLIADTDPRGDDPLGLAFSADGSMLYAAHLTGNSIDVHLRDGTRLHSLQVGQPVDALVHGLPDTCFQDHLLYTRTDGTAWAIPTLPGSSPRAVAAGGRAAAVSFASLDLDGNVVVPRLVDVTLLACDGFVPPVRPEGVAPKPPAAVVVAQAAAVSQPQPPAPNAPPANPAAPPPPVAAPPQPPIAPPAPPAGGAPVTSLGAQASLVDAREEEPILGLSASARRADLSAAWVRLALGALATLGLAAWSFVAIETHDRQAPALRKVT